jgi:putative transposase
LRTPTTSARKVFAGTAQLLMGQMSRQIRKQVKQLLYLLDSTSITLKGEKFDSWTLDNRTRNTQGIKLHVLLASEPQAPVWYDFSAANINDVEKTDAVPLHKNALHVFDKGYCDYNWWHRIDAVGAQFVTRFKRNAGLRVERELPIPAQAAAHVLQDRIVRFRNKAPAVVASTSTTSRCALSAWPDATSQRPWYWRPMICTAQHWKLPSTIGIAGKLNCFSNESNSI